jgi:hypothetical protein
MTFGYRAPSFSCSMGLAISRTYPSPTTSSCWRPISSERNPFISSARCPERPLALVVGRLDVAARQEHQRFAARGHGNARPLVAASTSIGSRSSRRSRSRRCRCVSVVLSARSGRRCPERAGILQERLELRTGAPRHGRGVSSYRFVTLGQQKQGRTANPKDRKQALCESKELGFLFKYLLTNSFFATYAAPAKVSEVKLSTLLKIPAIYVQKKGFLSRRSPAKFDC